MHKNREVPIWLPFEMSNLLGCSTTILSFLENQINFLSLD